MSNDILIQVVQNIGNSKFGLFAIQLDETTDVVNFAQLAVYVRYIHESKFEDDFLFCETIDTRTTAKDVFNKVDSFFQSQSLKWNNLCGICTDGAPAMLGCRSGFQTLVKQVSPRTTGIHCTIHRQVLASKTLPNTFKDVLTDVVKAINAIKSKALNSRLFGALCVEMGSDFEILLMHTEVLWLSKGKALKRAFALSEEVEPFLEKDKNSIRTHFKDMDWLTFLQGSNSTILDSHGKLRGFKMKLYLWHGKMDKASYPMFPTLNSFIDERTVNISNTMKNNIKVHLTNMDSELERYFPELVNVGNWKTLIYNPFISNVEDLPTDDYTIQQEFIDLINNGVLDSQLENKSLS